MPDTITISTGLAFLAGLVSFLSPCILPLVPAYLSFITGRTLGELEGARGGARWSALLHASLFVLGFLLVFVGLGASATVVGGGLRDALPLLRQVGGVLVIGFGLSLLGILRIPALLRERRMRLARKPAGATGTVAAGMAFAAGWTPCIGPILGSILLYAGLEATMGKGLVLLAAYGVGLGVPFLASAVALDGLLGRIGSWRDRLVWFERATGAVLVIVGALLASGQFTVISSYLAGFGQLINLEM